MNIYHWTDERDFIPVKSLRREDAEGSKEY